MQRMYARTLPFYTNTSATSFPLAHLFILFLHVVGLFLLLLLHLLQLAAEDLLRLQILQILQSQYKHNMCQMKHTSIIKEGPSSDNLAHNQVTFSNNAFTSSI